MTSHSDNLNAELLLALQRGLPLEPRPFARIAERLGLTEDDVLARTVALFEAGTARRFGAVFDSRGLGYEATLCAVDAPAEAIERVAGVLAPNPGITHCYQREGRPNLWFTVTAPADGFTAELERIAATLRPLDMLSLPARRVFKINVVFDTRQSGGEPIEAASSPPPDHSAPPAPLTERERAVVRRLQESIPLVKAPFDEMSRELGCAPDELLRLLDRWTSSRVLRRIGLIVRHRKLGFSANGMCVWNVGAERLADAGRRLAGCPEVTHCYERIPPASFPFNLFAMIHAKTRDAAQAVFDRVSRAAGLTGGRMLVSVREFKKSSPVFFADSGDDAARRAS